MTGGLPPTAGTSECVQNIASETNNTRIEYNSTEEVRLEMQLARALPQRPRRTERL